MANIPFSPLFRASYIGAVVNSYSTLMAAHRGEVVCEVKTAKPLDAAMLKEVEGALKGFLKGNEKALINYSVDPAIIGGMVRGIIGFKCWNYIF